MSKLSNIVGGALICVAIGVGVNVCVGLPLVLLANVDPYLAGALVGCITGLAGSAWITAR